MNTFDNTLRFLYEAVHNFHWASAYLYHPKSKRLEVLKKFATELKIAAENFIKACEELEHETGRTLQTRR